MENITSYTIYSYDLMSAKTYNVCIFEGQKYTILLRRQNEMASAYKLRILYVVTQLRAII